ncbi:MAG: metalloregulator ArsR/SmtB family transcription factor [Oscillospiraceae bacterium]|nr:metalloregulator ArsR/SmtB family transcription factor [Oscillospiraceae bacterium]MDD7292299.1 metalloregulator ArsR/SmtB family transcription factor [Clostridiaceae bacterium]MDY5992104.1 metalloregulator ArsR/SmtB family transcription factor [Oscillospiraceae bacterium]
MGKTEMGCDCTHIDEELVRLTKKNMPDDELIFDLAEFFKVFADSTRMKILWALHENELCVCDIAVVLNMTKSAVSHQLKYLRGANLVKNRKDGKIVYYSLSDSHVKEIFEMAVEHLEELN